MAEKKLFRCPRCHHSEEDRVPHRARCPRCGYAIIRPDRDLAIDQARRRFAQLPL